MNRKIIFSIPIFLILILNPLYLNATDESLYNGDRGIEGKIFCDIQYQKEDRKHDCYDRNDNPKEYCEKYRELDADFCEIIEDDNPTRFSDADFKGLADCSNDGYRDGQNNSFDQERNEECEELNEKTGTNEGAESTYYLSFIDGCIDAGNKKETCENFTDA
jgi:hypothetical protein